MSDDPSAGALSPAAKFQQQVILHFVSGKGTTFVSLYVLFAIFFSVSIVLCIFAALAAFMAGVFGKAQPDDIAAFFRLIASFDFGNSALKSISGAQTDALIAACALAAGIALLVLAAISGLALRALKRQRVSERAVAALLPGSKRGVVPCAEGIYKLCYCNLWTKNRFYCLYPWESLSLYAIEEAKQRVVLKAGKVLMPLVAGDREGGLFESLKAVVLEHLPMERQVLPAKKMGYRWVRVVVAVLVLFALQAVFALWLESATGKGGGTEYCDVRGKLHYSFRTAFSTQVYFYEMQGDPGQSPRKYCELHGVIYVTLHPAVYVPSLRALMQQSAASPSPVRSVMIAEMLVFPAMVWLDLLALVLYTGVPPRFRFNRL